MRTAFVLLFVPVRVSRGFCNPVRRHSLGRTRRGIALPSTMSSTGYFLLKSEPSEFSIQDLEKRVVAEWDGVRNFEARNIMRTMQKGDRAFFYHSSSKNAGIVGTVVITRKAQPDATAYQDPNQPGYDPKSTADNCRWDSVEINFDTVFPAIVTLKELKSRANTDEVIAQMTLLKKSRLSVQQVTAAEWSAVNKIVDEEVAVENIL